MRGYRYFKSKILDINASFCVASHEILASLVQMVISDELSVEDNLYFMGQPMLISDGSFVASLNYSRKR